MQYIHPEKKMENSRPRDIAHEGGIFYSNFLAADLGMYKMFVQKFNERHNGFIQFRIVDKPFLTYETTIKMCALVWDRVEMPHFGMTQEILDAELREFALISRYYRELDSKNQKPNVEQSDTLPGTMIVFDRSGSSGSREDTYGNGEISFHLHRPDYQCPWVDLGHIYYSSPTAEQYEDMVTSPNFDDGSRALGDYNRRLSKKQAHLIRAMISKFLMEEFKGVIPADDEIDAFIEEKGLSRF